MLGHKQQRVQKLQMTHFHVTTLSRQARFDTLQLLLAYLHSLTITPNISLVLTRPSDSWIEVPPQAAVERIDTWLNTYTVWGTIFLILLILNLNVLRIFSL